MAVLKVGILSCSGEECLGGTISRLATRKVLEELKFIDTVTLCLPLYLAGFRQYRLTAAINFAPKEALKSIAVRSMVL
jgi:hypothetical protein